MKNTILILLLFLSFVTFSQNETDWKYIANAKDGSEIYVKIENISSYRREAWVKMTNPVVSKKSKNGKIIKTGGGYMLAFWSINCEDKTFSLSNRITYNSSGKVISVGNNYDDPQDERIIPDTVGEYIFRYICDYSSE